MKKKRAKNKTRIPEALGNRACSIWLYVLVLVSDAAVHGTLLYFHGLTPQSFFRLFFSFLFFIYPLYYVADTLWSLRPSVCGILSGELLINRKYYMNTVRKEVAGEALFPVTVSVPVYLESNETIFETLRESLAAAKRYRLFSGKTANVLVSDDGLAPLLGGRCTKEKVEALLRSAEDETAKLTQSEKKAAERLRFYRAHELPFVARPAAGRRGLFKKASNLNFTLRLGKLMAAGTPPERLTGEGAAFAGGYAEGDIVTHEIILLLDKDSGVKEGIIEAIIPEFAADERLAYVQCATSAVNLNENYYTGSTGRQINNLFHNIWPCKALQGFFVPLVGHNVFIRKSLLEKSGLWAEDRVSEDYDKALCFYSMGWHGKYAQIRGLEFTEYASRTFTEETGKQHRYAYGLFELFFDGTVFQKEVRGCDAFYMLLYFCSVINQVMLLPTVLLESYFGNIHLLWAGFLFCMLCFILLPLTRSLVMRRRLPKETLFGLPHTLIIAVSFVGHSFSFLAGAFRYLSNKLKENRAPFPSTNVDQLEYRFRDGMKLLLQYIRKNPVFLLIAFLCLDRGILLLTRKGIEPATTFTYAYILFCAALVPVFLTTPLFNGFFRGPSAMNHVELRGLEQRSEEGEINMRTASGQGDGDREQSPLVVGERASDGPAEGDMKTFLENYREVLLSSLQEEDMPEELLSEYTFESCLRKEPEGRKELYLLRRKEDGVKALLRITKNYPEEDALEEAKLLQRLEHPGIPRMLSACEKNGRNYLVREYVEGRTLYEVVSSCGCLGADDILGIALKLSDILCYLHGQIPPVIHRDIKPQNIVVGYDGSIHLIDFGIAREHKWQRRQDTSVVLTLDYAPPEQYGFEQTTPLSDLYSFGVVLLFLASGRTIRSDLEAQIINNRLRELIERCIAFNPKMRIQSAEEIRAYILRTSDRQRIQRGRRLAVAASFAAVIFLSVFAFGAGFIVERRSAEARGYERGYEIGYADGYDAAPAPARGAPKALARSGTNYGNMAAAGGAFAAYGDGSVFYIKDGGIWRMSANGADAELLVQEEAARALSYENGWLYYSSDSRILQSNLYTGEKNVLCEDTYGSLYVTEGSFHVLAEDSLYRLYPQSGLLSLTAGLSGCTALHIGEEQLYFIGAAGSALYRCGSDGSALAVLTEGDCRSFCLYGKRIFCSAKGRDGIEHLLVLDSEADEATILSETEAALLHVTGDGIFFLDAAEGTLSRCSFDGRFRERVSENRAGDFNLAGSWIFYHNDEDGGRLWCVRLDGSNDHPVP